MLCLGLLILMLSRPNVHAESSLTSFSAGARVVAISSQYDDGQWSAAGILDESPKVGWASATGKTTNQWIVIELAEKTVLSSLEFDTASANKPDGAARKVTIDVSDGGSQTGFATIATAELKDRADRQRLAVTTEVPGRWVKVTIHDNFGNNQWIYLMDFRGYGKQLTRTPLPDVSGTYKTTYGPMHLRQEGTSLTGCYGTSGQTISGGIDGKVMSLTWRHQGSRFGPAMMVFSSEGTEFSGYWWEGKADADPATGTRWAGQKTSDNTGTCPDWSGGFQAELNDQLEKIGRSRIYGIHFDLDSEVIRPESKLILDKIASLLAAKSGWRLMIEGHTDATGRTGHNLELSRRRAAAVKHYFISKGVDASRLETVGFGESRPVAPNETALGRGQNRRVELVRL